MNSEPKPYMPLLEEFIKLGREEYQGHVWALLLPALGISSAPELPKQLDVTTLTHCGTTKFDA